MCGITNHIVKVIFAHYILPTSRELQSQIPILWIYNCPKQLHLALQIQRSTKMSLTKMLDENLNAKNYMVAITFSLVNISGKENSKKLHIFNGNHSH